ncbi:MAG: GAF domain-containing protein, partial [Bacteroidota bacterium]
MSSELVIDKSKSDEDIYKQLSSQLDHLIDPNDKLISNLSNFTAALKQSFNKISWVGFYIENDGKLFLGPFQGKTACTEITIDKGVCGSAAEKRTTLIVEDVEKFIGHIVCDSDSSSEIVIPIILNEKVWGVLDIDSNLLSAFNEIDKYYLEQFCNLLVSKLELDKF